MKSEWDEYLDKILYLHVSGEPGDEPGIYNQLYDALFYVRYGRHNPYYLKHYPDRLASRGLIQAVRRRTDEVRARLTEERGSSGSILLHRGGNPSGISWTSQYTSTFTSKPLTSKDIPIKRIALDPTELYRGSPESSWEEEYLLFPEKPWEDKYED